MQAPVSLIQLSANLAVASVMVTLTVLVSFWGFLGLTWAMQRSQRRLQPHAGKGRAALLVLFVVFGIFVLHTVQIWLYALLYLGLGELRTFEEALYFSTTTFASLGFGDIVLSPRWRMLSAIEAANGLILFAWSTAFLLTVTSRLRLVEHEWLEPKPKRRD